MFNKSGLIQCTRGTPGAEGELGFTRSSRGTTDAGQVGKQVFIGIFAIARLDPRLFGVDFSAQHGFQLPLEHCKMRGFEVILDPCGFVFNRFESGLRLTIEHGVSVFLFFAEAGKISLRARGKV